MATVNGTPNDDDLFIPSGVSGETLLGLAGNDILDAGFAAGNNILKGGDGNDQLFANTNDQLFGEAGNDILSATDGKGGNTLSGGDGNDTIFASLNDSVFGDAGNDIIFGGLGGNTLTGGLGRDVFWIAVTDIPNSPNTIADFNPVNDTIRIKLAEVNQLSDLTFTQSGSDAIISLTAGGKQQLAIIKDTLVSDLNATTVAIVDSTPNNPTVNLGPSITKGGSDIFKLTGDDKVNPSLQFIVNSNSANQVSEIGVFIVDDAAGNIDGVSPNQSGYAEKALAKAKVIFSVIDNSPNGFNENGLGRLLEFSDSDKIRFYTINDKATTTDSVLKSKSYDKVNFSPTNDLGFSDLSGGGYSIKFNGLDVSIKASKDILEIGTGLQDRREGEVLDLSQGFDTTAFSKVKVDFTVNREAAYDDFIGFYKIENAQGDIKKSDGTILSVGQSGYIQAAVAGRISGIDLSVPNQSTQTSSSILQAGSIFAPFIVVNGSPTAILDSNPDNDPAVYFPFLGANSDKVDHIRLLANNTFGFEDLPSGGDFDYNDMIVKVKLTPIA